MLDFLDFVFRFLGLNRPQVARQAGDAGGLLGQLEQILSVPFVGFYVVLIIAGLALCLFGRQLFWAAVFIGGAVVGALVGALVDALQGGVGAATGFFALVGGILAVLLQHVLNFIIGGLIVGVLLFLAVPHWMAFLFGFLLGGIAAISVFRFFVAVVTSFKGAAMVGSSVKALMEPFPALQPLRDLRDMMMTLHHLLTYGQFPQASGSGAVLGLQPASWGLIITVLCFVLGVWFQLRRPARRRGAAGASALAGGLLDDDGFDLDLDDGIGGQVEALGDMPPDGTASPRAPSAAPVASVGQPPPLPAAPRPVPGGAVLPPPVPGGGGAAARVAEVPRVPRPSAPVAEPPPLPSSVSGNTPPAAIPARARASDPRVAATAPVIRPPPARPEDAGPVAARAGGAGRTRQALAALVLLGLLGLGGYALWEPGQRSRPSTGAAPAATTAPSAPQPGAPRSQAAGWTRNLAPAGALPLPAGRCALIIASRQSVEEARQVLRAHGVGDTGAIYRARNGWYAVAAGLLPEARARDRIAAKVRQRAIPPDSLCSSGQGYVARVWP